MVANRPHELSSQSNHKLESTSKNTMSLQISEATYCPQDKMRGIYSLSPLMRLIPSNRAVLLTSAMTIDYQINFIDNLAVTIKHTALELCCMSTNSINIDAKTYRASR